MDDANRSQMFCKDNTYVAKRKNEDRTNQEYALYIFHVMLPRRKSDTSLSATRRTTSTVASARIQTVFSQYAGLWPANAKADHLVWWRGGTQGGEAKWLAWGTGVGRLPCVLLLLCSCSLTAVSNVIFFLGVVVATDRGKHYRRAIFQWRLFTWTLEKAGAASDDRLNEFSETVPSRFRTSSSYPAKN